MEFESKLLCSGLVQEPEHSKWRENGRSRSRGGLGSRRTTVPAASWGFGVQTPLSFLVLV